MSETLGKYRIDQVLSKGGSATTYKAYQPQLDRPVLLKVLHPSLTKDEKSVERFSREAKAIARIRHEGIVHIYDYGRSDGQYYIAMEYVEGLSLAELLARNKRLPTDVATYVISESARSLGFAHSKGIVHRDIKPGNIILAYDGAVKVTDFGLAYSENLSSITVDGELFGTPSYMSPEQIKGEKLDARTDIYSLGLTFYQILSGVQPFRGSNYSAIITKKLTENPTPLKRLLPDCPQRLINTVSKMTERSAAKRFQSMDELVRELTVFGTESGTRLDGAALVDYLRRDGEGEQPPPITEVPRKRKRLPLYIALAALVLVVAGFTAIRMRPERVTNVVKIPLLPPPTEPDTAIGMGSIFVTTDPPGASILLDGVTKQSMTPVAMAGLEPGKHEISVILDGYRTETRIVDVGARETVRAGFVLRPLAGIGFLKVGANPWAAVYVDGDSVDTTPFNRLLRLDRGSHEIILCNPDFPDYRSEVEITPGRTTDVFIDLTRIWSQARASGSAGYARINVDPWAAVYVDGDSVDTTPFNRLLRLERGRHKLVLSNPNYPDCAMFLEVVEGATTDVNIDLKNEFGYLMLNVDPWADVYVDGEYRDTTPLSKPIPVLPGEHVVRLVGPFSTGWERRLYFQRGETVTQQVDMSRG